VPYFLSEGDGEHSVLIDSLFTVLLSADATGGQFGVFTLDAPKGRAIPPHSHGSHHEIFYVVRGGVTVFLDDQTASGRYASWFGRLRYVPAGIVHAYRVETDQTRVLGVSTAGFERFFSVLGDPPMHRRIRSSRWDCRRWRVSSRLAGGSTPPSCPTTGWTRDRSASRRTAGLFDPITEPLPPAVPLGEGGGVWRAFRTRSGPGFRPLQLDLYQPAAAAPARRCCSCTVAGGGSAAAACSARPGVTGNRIRSPGSWPRASRSSPRSTGSVAKRCSRRSSMM
jgi:quercetin dioxygenase-like cupin family protein